MDNFMGEHYLSLRYRDKNENVRDIVVLIPDCEYQEKLSYKENLQNVVGDMYADGGVWVDENTIIPYHRIICIECSDGTTKKSEPTKEISNKNHKRRSFESRNNKRAMKNDYQSIEPSSSTSTGLSTNIV